MLLLFKPFRCPADLRSDDVTWPAALQSFLQTASTRTLRYLDNIDAIATAAEAGQTVAKQRRAALEAGQSDAYNEDLAHVGLIGEDVEENKDSAERHLEAELFAPLYDAVDRFGNVDRRDALRAQVLLSTPNTDVGDRYGVIRKVEHALQQFGMFEPSGANRREAKQQPAFAVRGSEESASAVAEAARQLKDQRLKLIESYVKGASDAKRPPNSDGKSASTLQPCLVPIEMRKTADVICQEAGTVLKPAQILALRIVSDRLLPRSPLS